MQKVSVRLWRSERGIIYCNFVVSERKLKVDNAHRRRPLHDRVYCFCAFSFYPKSPIEDAIGTTTRLSFVFFGLCDVNSKLIIEGSNDFYKVIYYWQKWRCQLPAKYF